MQFRGMEPNDIEAMYALDVICFAPPFRFSCGDMQRFALSRKARVVLAEEDGALAGFCIVHIEQPRSAPVGYVLTLDVAPQHRHRSLGSDLMRRAEHLAAADGCLAVLLHVFVENASAIRLYERLGYLRTETAMNFYGPGLHAFVYEKTLPGRA